MPKTSQDFLLLQGRNFGDAVIGTGLIEALGNSFPDSHISVFTKPQFQSLHLNNPHVSAVYTANFPTGTGRQFGVWEAIGLLREIWSLRKCGFTRVIHIEGDFRENIFGWLISPMGVVSPEWAQGHPFHQLIRDGLSMLRLHPVPIGINELSIYTAQERVAEALGATAPCQPRLYADNGKKIIYTPEGNIVGLHVSASQEFKRWPVSFWRDLILGIRARGMSVKIFASPEERADILADYGDMVNSTVEIVTGSLGEFFLELSRVRTVVCLDSFSVHAAHAIGVPCLMLNGAHLAALCVPPTAFVIDGGQGLSCAPCMNKPTCRDSSRPYQCMRNISPNAVLEAFDVLDSRQISPETV